MFQYLERSHHARSGVMDVSNQPVCPSSGRLILTLCLLLALCGPLQVALAQCETKLLASDGSDYDSFGTCVSIDGDLAVVGADFADGAMGAAGAAYVLRHDGSAWHEEAKIFATDGRGSDYFGRFVAIDNDVIVAGAPNHEPDLHGQGAAYIFRYDGSSWLQVAKLRPSDLQQHDSFGVRVAIDSNVVVIGATGVNGDRGAVYVYRNDGVGWSMEAKLLASDGVPEDRFGISVSVSGDVLIVGANYDDSRTGAAYVYRFNGTTWQEEAKLIATDAQTFTFFGTSVSTNGQEAVVGAFSATGNALSSGAAYVYKCDGSDWVEVAKLAASDGESGDYFGESVSISSNLIVIGATVDSHSNGSFGSAYVYRYEDSHWLQSAKLTASDGDGRHGFGLAVSLTDDATTVVGCRHDDDLGTKSGSAYVYQLAECPVLEVSPTPLVAGEYASFGCTGMTPNTQTFLAYSLRGPGSTYVPPLDITLDLKQPAQAGEATLSDSTGTAGWRIRVPNAGAGREVWFQACQYQVKSNVVATSVE
ncbi:MAG: hypothetical protein D8M59_12935 [Planctomycetes bacterium]|nr:hypothetical protein [Planctomycetota bacterium]NOG54914.1 hypothetical protein [Planctomycetota bacterium]